MARIGDEDRMLILRRKAFIGCFVVLYRGSGDVEFDNGGIGLIDHRLDCDTAPCLKAVAFTLLAVRGHERVTMENAADAVPTNVFNRIITFTSREFVNGETDVSGGGRGRNLLNSLMHGFKGHFTDLFGFIAYGTYEKHGRSVAVKTFVNAGDVDVDDVALFKKFRSGDSMAYAVIHGRANRLRKAVVAQRRRLGPPYSW